MRRQAHETTAGQMPLLPTTVVVPVCRVHLVQESTRVLRRVIERSEDAAEALAEYIGQEDREHFAVLMLNAKNEVLGIHTASIGTLVCSLVSPREVFKAAILANASAVIVGHNHPSGNPDPSPEDYKVTERLKAAGELLDIPLLDHIVIGEWGKYVSLGHSSAPCL